MEGFHNVLNIQGLKLIKNFYMEDLRGNFLKVYQHSKLPQEITDLDFREIFVSTSAKNVIRGMHFQTPPYETAKLITVISGKVLDVVLDMRRSSETFANIYSVFLGGDCEFRSMFIPAGCAHGFLTLTDNASMLYACTNEFVPAHDTGVRFDSIDFTWPVDREKIIISGKDKLLASWDPETTPFD